MLLPLLAVAMMLTPLLGVRTAAAQTAPAERAPLTAVCPALLDRIMSFQGRVGFVAVDLTDGARCLSNPTEEFPTASLYKLVVMAEAFRQREAGDLTFRSNLTVTAADHIDDPAEFRPPGSYSVSIEEGMERMIQLSDNGAATALRLRLGDDRVAAAPAGLSLMSTHLTGEYRTNAADIAQFLVKLHGGRVVSAEASAEMVELLAGQTINDRLPVGLPAGARIAHKTGNLDAYSHDAGIVYTAGGDFVIVVLTEAKESVTAAYDLSADLASLTYEVIASRPAPARAEVVLPENMLTLPATAGAGMPALGLGGTSSSGLSVGDGAVTTWWTSPGGLAALVAMLVVALAAGVGARRGRWMWPMSALVPRRGAASAGDAASGYAMAMDVRSMERRARVSSSVPVQAATEGGKDSRMRFGARSPREHQDGEDGGSFMDVASERQGGDRQGSDRRGAAAPPVSSPRLQRLRGYFTTQSNLLHEMEEQVQNETLQLADLLARQQATMSALLAGLDDRLRPLNEYAATEERNLADLEQRMNQQGMDFIARSFSDYMDSQRRRIGDTRAQISAQRAPFERYGADQREAVETALSRFDDDLDALEANLTEQRKVIMRMLDAMRSEAFVAAREFLAARAAALHELAQASITDPAEIGTRLRALRAQLAQREESRGGGPGGAFLRRLLEVVDEADGRLLEVSGAARSDARAEGRAEPATRVVAVQEADEPEERTA